MTRTQSRRIDADPAPTGIPSTQLPPPTVPPTATPEPKPPILPEAGATGAGSGDLGAATSALLAIAAGAAGWLQRRNAPWNCRCTRGRMGDHPASLRWPGQADQLYCETCERHCFPDARARPYQAARGHGPAAWFGAWNAPFCTSACCCCSPPSPPMSSASHTTFPLPRTPSGQLRPVPDALIPGQPGPALRLLLPWSRPLR